MGNRYRAGLLAAGLSISTGIAQVVPNYVKTKTYDDKGNAQVAISYIDGLKRSVQTVGYAELDGEIISHTTILSSVYYDAFGKDWLSTLPFPDASKRQYIPLINSAVLHGNPSECPFLSAINNYYSVSGRNAEGYPYSESQRDQDLTGRLKSAGVPGRTYSLDQTNGHPGTYWYFGTKPGITIDANVDERGLILPSKFPSIGTLPRKLADNPTLFLTVIQNADGRFSQELKDGFGNSILQWADIGNGDTAISRIAYDILGTKLSETPPSEDGTNDVGSSAAVHDTRGGTLSAFTPDAGTVEYLYNSGGQIKCSRNAVQAISNNCYTVLNYDAFGRMVEIGINATDRSWPPNELDERFAISLRQLNFYDNAAGLGNYVSDDILSTLSFTNGKIVASIAFDENAVVAAIDIFSYDAIGRIARKYKLIQGQEVRIFDFTYDEHNDKPLEASLRNCLTCSPNAIQDYEYDSWGNLSKVFMNGKLKVEYIYDDLNRLSHKYFYSTDGTTRIEDISYDRTVQNWLQQIKTNINADLFSENLWYGEIDQAPSGTQPRYSGAISASVTKQLRSSTETFQKNLSYLYDGLDHLTAVKGSALPADPNVEECLAYYKDGRIKEKYVGTSTIPSDNKREYQYEYNSLYEPTKKRNQVGFVTNSNGQATNNYIYDLNGNLILDKAKKMSIQYNWRDLPIRFSFFSGTLPSIVQSDDVARTGDLITSYLLQHCDRLSSVEMSYDAAGNRVRKAVRKL
jgi:hypothetical protein